MELHILPQTVLGNELGQLRDGEQGVGDLRGLGVSPGIARGRVRIVRSAAELSAFEPDEILVTESLDPTWTLGYSQAAALISERGATLSHGAIVAREFGIPAVVNVAGCISRLHSGQVLEVDGSKGTVTLTH